MKSLLLGFGTLLYPVWVYASVSYGWLWLAPVPLLLLLLARLWLQKDPKQRGFAALTLLVLLLALLAGQTELALLYYPVWINAGLLLIFAWSLYFPPTVIERLARLMEGELPESGVRYTRKVTQVWCLFFFGNGSVAACLAWYGNWQWWLWYNGALSYLLMGLLFGAEYLVRRRVKQHG
ncbi:MAG TPA: hypothetical protein DF774_00425 [Rheinheimera sp.]|uniref:COG4648 family protein n=1 Tax=Rheinheimera sp. TaxID=1869214 RepID=UPI000EE06778|nr:hypothetical protein [Rheinheimera sp.]HCU64203.1 hypothetical protein [Rheinheimera sp.]